MADNVAITQGAGTTIATEVVAGAHLQVIKIGLGATDLNNGDLDGTTTRGAYVDHRGNTIAVPATPTVSTSAYTAGDQLGTLMTFAGASRISGGGGMIIGATLLDKTTAVRPTCQLFLFSQSVTVQADNAAAQFSDADRAFQVGTPLVFGSWSYETAIGSPINSMATIPAPASAATSVQGLAIPYTCGATSLFGAAVVINTPTLTATTDLIFTLILDPD